MNADASPPAGQAPAGPRERAPRLSVVIVADHYRTIRQVVEAFRAQTIHEQIEMVIVAPSRAALEAEAGAGDGFSRWVVVEAGSIDPARHARAAGVRATTAPVVFLGETHSFPHPGFAAALLAAHAAGWEVIVPGIDNANPQSATSWAGYLMDYGNWHPRLPAGQCAGGPTWNAAYRREALMALDGSLEVALAHGDSLRLGLQAQGCRWYFAPDARLDHLNVAQLGPWIKERYLAGMMVAVNRYPRWSFGRRCAYALATPLVVAVVLSRTARPMRALWGTGVLPWGTLLSLVAGTIVRGVGETMGYLFGPKPSHETRMEEYELHKLKYAIEPGS